MKKVFSIIAVALVATMVSCGPSAEEKAKMEADAKRAIDSAAAAANVSVEAAATETPADSTAAAATSTTAETPAH